MARQQGVVKVLGIALSKDLRLNSFPGGLCVRFTGFDAGYDGDLASEVQQAHTLALARKR